MQPQGAPFPGPRRAAGKLLAVALALALAMTAALLAARPCPAAPPQATQGQTLFLPLLEYVFLGKRNQPFPLSQTLVVRNTDPKGSLTITSLARHDGRGKPAGSCPSEQVTLGPLAAWSLGLANIEDQKNPAGSLLITWRADHPISPPLVECIMVGSAGQQGISFVVKAMELPPGR